MFALGNPGMGSVLVDHAIIIYIPQKECLIDIEAIAKYQIVEFNKGMIYSDRDIKEAVKDGRIGISPYSPDLVQPSSYDMRLLNKVRVFDGYNTGVIDVRVREDVSREVEIGENGFVLHPGEFILGSSIEVFTFSNQVVGQLNGKSSLGRLGLVVHATAGFFDPGFEGQVTFEIVNLSRLPIRIYAGMKIAQFAFLETKSPVEKPYGSKGLGSKYKGQRGPTASLMYKNYEK